MALLITGSFIGSGTSASKSASAVMVRCSLREPIQEGKRKKSAETIACIAFGQWFDKMTFIIAGFNMELDTLILCPTLCAATVVKPCCYWL
jgi:predicted AlkP superfamily pyrophosphatase or phosphodiesterase